MNITHIKECNTSINDILDLADKNTVFISSWDKSDNILNFDNKLIEQSITDLHHKNTYIMSKDMLKIKEKITGVLHKKTPYLNTDNITIVSNGTCAAFISILQLIKNNVKNCLIIGPIYFTYFNLLRTFNLDIYNLSFDLFSPSFLDIKGFEQILISYNIESIIIIQPFFGSGINLSTPDIEKILNITNKMNIYTLFDYVYGNMNWNSSDFLTNEFLVNTAINSQYCILYESISKRIFLNGMKSAILYSNKAMISQINNDSETFLGSISYVQESLLNHIFNKDSVNYLNQTISDTLNYAKNNYFLLKTLLLQSDFLISPTESGYYTLLGIPSKHFRATTQEDIVKEIHEKFNVLVIPHTRYCYHKEDYFCFRINLVIETDKLIPAISSLLNICCY